MPKQRKYNLVEIGLISIALWWAVLLLSPIATFKNSVYSTMEQVMPEQLWGMQCLFISFFLLYGVATDNKIIRSIGLLISIGFWTFVSVSLWLSDSATTGTSYFVWALMAAGLYLKLMKVGDG
ncbi:TPA: hypothetical protein QC128_005111 [Bacillus cereus]|uniref:Uncharacterized protein n=1 Tax=Bacillus cereus TaxID=1396 RepID=A0A9X7A0G1_BACCE|nr:MULTISPECIES: hypothetical protein [Bacillus cereus group]NIE89398.1 hypothetical protein [Bacillus sp. Ab-1751]AKE16163.1 Phage protein [Bacillus cereus]KMQ30521.1 hypothetical protein TU58_05640 [Bacillus cereus]MCD2334846.1 hypothetical protein [Bacillus cereus]MDA2091431.1 hypothetical protein [Bacillus cereus]